MFYLSLCVLHFSSFLPVSEFRADCSFSGFNVYEVDFLFYFLIREKKNLLDEKQMVHLCELISKTSTS